jgi:hypothetical protein
MHANRTEQRAESRGRRAEGRGRGAVDGGQRSDRHKAGWKPAIQQTGSLRYAPKQPQPLIHANRREFSRRGGRNSPLRSQTQILFTSMDRMDRIRTADFNRESTRIHANRTEDRGQRTEVGDQRSDRHKAGWKPAIQQTGSLRYASKQPQPRMDGNGRE